MLELNSAGKWISGARFEDHCSILSILTLKAAYSNLVLSFHMCKIDPEVSFGTVSLRAEEVENVICCTICSAVCLYGV